MDSIYDNIAEGIRVRSKCDWHEHEGKSSKFFLSLEKHRGTQVKIRKLISGNIEIVAETKISKKIKKKNQKLYEKTLLKSQTEINIFLELKLRSYLTHKNNFAKRK